MFIPSFVRIVSLISIFFSVYIYTILKNFLDIIYIVLKIKEICDKIDISVYREKRKSV